MPQRIRLSAAVMTHPERREHAERLRARLPELNLQIVTDPAPDASALRTAKLAWATVEDGATHHLVLQDDAAPCPDFHAKLMAALTAAPNHAVCLFTEWGSETSYVVRLALMLDLSWAEVIDHYVPSVALVLPAPLARGFAHYDGFDGPQDDVAIRMFLTAQGVPARITVPNLVDHLSLPSMVGSDYMGPRHSVCPTPADLAVDWTGDQLTLPAVPIFCWLTGSPVCVVRDDTAEYGWSRKGVRWLLNRHGLEPEPVARQGHTIVTALRREAPDLRAGLLFGLWVTAFGLGVVLANHAGTVADRVLGKPLVAHALSTVSFGGLKLYLKHERLTELADRLHALVADGVRHGHAAVRAKGMR